MISGILDTFSSLRRYKIFIIIGYCMGCFLLALPMCAPVNRKVKIDDEMNFFVFIYRVEFIYSYVDFFIL